MSSYYLEFFPADGGLCDKCGLCIKAPGYVAEVALQANMRNAADWCMTCLASNSYVNNRKWVVVERGFKRS